MFLALVFLVAVLSGATAALAGFGIGSLLTPVLALRLGVPVAIVAVALPHAAATLLRFIRLRSSVRWTVVRSFGILSACGGLAGALLHSRLSGRLLTLLLAGLLLATAAAGLTGWSRRWHPRGAAVAGAGLLSGFFGGVAGNQGGLRAAALLAFPMSPVEFVATSTAIALLVDVARTPVYLWSAGATISGLAVPIVVASAGVLLGTLLGERVMLGLTIDRFQQVVSSIIAALGIWLLAGAM